MRYWFLSAVNAVNAESSYCFSN